MSLFYATNIVIIRCFAQKIREFFNKYLLKHCLYYKSRATLLHLLPNPRGDILRETVHKFAGDGVVHAHDEAVVDLAGSGALGLAGTVAEAAEIQEAFLDGVGEGEGAAHLVAFGDGDVPAAVGLSGMEPQGPLHGQALGTEHPLALRLQRLFDEPFLDTHNSSTISMYQPLQLPNTEYSGTTSAFVSSSPMSGVQGCPVPPPVKSWTSWSRQASRMASRCM